MISRSQFQDIKIQHKTIDLSTRLWGGGGYSAEPHAEVYCVRLNFNISKTVFENIPNISKFVKNAPLRVIFSTLLGVWKCGQTH